MQNAGLDDSQPGIKIVGRSINNLRYADDTTLVAETEEEPGIKLPTSTGSSKKQESSRKTSISALLTMPKILTVWITTNCGKNSSRDGNTGPSDLSPEKSVCRPSSNSYNWTWNNRLVPNRERRMSRLYIVTQLI